MSAAMISAIQMNLKTCSRTTCVGCACRVPVETVNESGVCVTCEHFAEIEPRLTDFERINRLSDYVVR
jgi:hypothetical protein